MSKKKYVSKNYMECVFNRNEEITWSENDSFCIVLDIENKGFFNRIAQRFFKRPKISHITLDKYGSCVWKLLDGKNTVFDIVNSMKSNFPDEQDKMLNRVVTFLYTLQVNKYIQ